MFNNVLGNNIAKKLLIDSVKIDKTSHSYLFIGTEGIGKKLIAEELAKTLLCVKKDDYCNCCKSCIEFDTNNNPDFTLIEPDGNSIKIEQIRNLLKNIAEKPIISDKKVYIINDSDKMTEEAQNCLLKTLEEPPEYVTIILIGSNENAYLSTIKSRCNIIHFEKISNDIISKYLNENCKKLEVNANVIIKACQGSIGKALKIINKQEQYEEIQKIISNIEKSDIIDIFNMSDIIYKSKEDRFDILDFINVILGDLAINSNIKYAECISIVENTKIRLIHNANYDMSIDNMLLQIYEKVN